MSDEIEAILREHIKSAPAKPYRPTSTLNRNLQAEINKIRAITTLVASKDIEISEINRLESSLNVLASVIQSVKANAQAINPD